ncbi:50S ribosomal protein L17 [Blattabacterium cuenoti]|uniref:50S ribosomal protein L17 n=1 Tax=Blattabacterium cuenoti TaxID=1653831 RepID=UPI00163CACA0|nr:50S ribosomal protein L17 [Blattabacterium cuenoti]
MNHRNKNNHLGRKYGHRKSILSNLASSLIKEKKIFTTLAKAKSLKKYIEPIITKSKVKTTHSKRNVFSYLRDKIAVSELFKSIFDKVRVRPGGYTRIIKTEVRLGDQSPISLIELVDFNEFYHNKNKSQKLLKSVRRSKKKKIISIEEKIEEKKDSKDSIEEKIEEKKDSKDSIEEKIEEKKDSKDSIEEKKDHEQN